MDTDRESLVFAWVRRLRELPSSQWEPALRAEAPGDATLHAAVLEYLRASTPANDSVLQALQGAVHGPTAGEQDYPTIPGFSIKRLLGRGGMGLVYEAEDETLGRTVAIKIVGGPLSPRLRERFQREITALARLEHPNIVQVHGSGTVGGAPFVVMRRVEGQPLTTWLRDADSPVRRDGWRQVVRLGASVARALAHAHEHGVVHRDVKPANILVDARGEPVLIDFGLARDEAHESITLSGEFVGTLWYTAPEQALGRVVDRRADVFGLGATLHHLLVGRPPYQAHTVSDLVRLFHAGPAPRPSRLNPALPRDLATVLEYATAPNVHERYASCADLADDLRAVDEGQPIAARRVGRAERVWRWTKRRPASASLLLVGAIAMTLAVHMGWRAWQERGEEIERQYLRRLELAQDLVLTGSWSPAATASRGEGTGEALRSRGEVELSRLTSERPFDERAWLLRIVNALRPMMGGQRTRARLEDRNLDRARDMLQRAPETLRSEPAGIVLTRLVAGTAPDALSLQGIPTPRTVDARVRMALVLACLCKQNQEAMAQLGAALASIPHDEVAHRLRALMTWDSVSLEGYDSALYSWTRQPENGRSLMLLALHTLTLGREGATGGQRKRLLEQAVERARGAHRLAPEDPSVLCNLAYVVEAAAVPEWEVEVVDLYRRAIALGDPVAGLNLRNVLWRQGKLKPLDVFELFEPILDYYGHSSAYWHDLAWAYDKTIGPAAAVVALERGLDHVADSERYQLHGLLAQYHLDMRDTEHRRLARAQWRRAMEFAPDDAAGMATLAHALGAAGKPLRLEWVKRCLRLSAQSVCLGRETLDLLVYLGYLMR